MEGATSISTISLVDMGVGSFSPYIYVPTPWVKAHQNYHGGAPSLRNLSCSKLYFSPLSLAVAATLPSPAILSSATSKSAAFDFLLSSAVRKPFVRHLHRSVCTLCWFSCKHLLDRHPGASLAQQLLALNVDHAPCPAHAASRPSLKLRTRQLAETR
jgi:hypothetical protein